MPQQLLGTTQGQYSTSTRIPLNTPPTVTLPSFTMKSPISNLGPLLSIVVFFLYTLVSFSINRSNKVSEVRVTVLLVAVFSSTENTLKVRSRM